MFSNAYSGVSGVPQPELDPSLTLHEHPYAGNVHNVMMAQGGGLKSTQQNQESQYALPPITQTSSRPSLSEIRRPQTSAGVLQHLISAASHSTDSPDFSSHGDFNPSPEITSAEQAYNPLGGMMMQQTAMQRPDLRTQTSGYAVALPPISQDFARPLTSETRRPATSAGIMQRSVAPGTFGAMSAFSSLDAQRRASIGLGTISEHQQQQQHHAHQQHHQQPQPQQQQQHHQQQQQSSGYNMTSAQAHYVNALEQQRRQSELSSYNGMFAHSIDGIDPNLTGMLNYMDITRRFSVPTLTNLPFKRTTTPASANTGPSALNSARSINNVRFNPVKPDPGNTVDGSYDSLHRPGSSGGPIFPTDYRMGLQAGFDPSTGTPNGFFPSAGDLTPQQHQQLYTLHSAASQVFPGGSYSSTGTGMIDHRNSSYSSVSTRHDSLTESSRNPSLPDIYLNQHLNHQTSMDSSRNPSLPDIYLNQRLQRRPSTGHSTTLADAAAHQMGLLNHNEEPSSGPVHKKRPRRKFDQIERLYLCGFEGCNKSYGTLNHLNAHVSMQKHGEKRRPEEFKEIRAAWRRRKKDEAKEAAEHAAVMNGGHVDLEKVEKATYEAQGKWLAH